ncbi:MAG: alpha/beta hydrolase, partial [Clostridiales bacterium]|nr:alpha/beta hydrolase [Clostridiales bacterium]
TALLKAVAHKESSMKPEAFIYRIRQLASKRFGFDINMCDCALYAGRIKVPVLLFQGGDDDVCLPSGTRNIYDNMRCKKRMVVIDSAKHLMAYEVAQATYEREVQKFIESCVMRLVKIGAV